MGEERSKKLTLTLQEIERKHQLASHLIEADKKIDPARSNEIVHVAVPAVHMALSPSQILASALPEAELQLILKDTQSLQQADGRQTGADPGIRVQCRGF